MDDYNIDNLIELTNELMDLNLKYLNPEINEIIKQNMLEIIKISHKAIRLKNNQICRNNLLLQKLNESKNTRFDI